MEFFKRILLATVFLLIISGLCLLLFISADKSERIPASGNEWVAAPVVDGTVRTANGQPRDSLAAASVSINQDIPAGIILEEMMRRDTSGLEITTDSTGMQTMSLDGRFTHVSAVIRDEQGNIRIQCFTGYPAMQAAMDGNPSTNGMTNEGNQGVAY